VSIEGKAGARDTAPAHRASPDSGGANGAGIGLFRQFLEDLDTVVARDPACTGRAEALLHLPWWALVLHRVAHRRHRRGARLGATAITLVARVVTGVEIHAGARVGRRLFLDHGTGIVVGETAVIGDDVTLYHHVTLGSRGWWNDDPDPAARRHPIIGDRVRIGVGASVLGAVRIAPDLLVRAHSLVLHDMPRQGGAR
jgi:serine O-acetyltransferase